MARRKGLSVNGWLVFDKPAGMTSTQAVSRVKRLYQAAKAGHAGTLDPLATGVLPIAFGEATKTVPFAVEGSKEYRFTVRFGTETDTDDAEGKAIAQSDRRPSGAEIEARLPDFTGDIEQVPPRYSALKVDGARAYDLARGEEEFELAPRRVSIAWIRFGGHPDKDRAVLEARCGKGTYVRALARDLGRALLCYGHVEALRRTRVGAFGEDSARDARSRSKRLPNGVTMRSSPRSSRSRRRLPTFPRLPSRDPMPIGSGGDSPCSCGAATPRSSKAPSMPPRAAR